MCARLSQCTHNSHQLVACFCSVVRRTVYTSARSWRTIHNLVCIASSSRLCRPYQISPIAMSSVFAPAHFSCSHSTPLTLTSSSSIPSSRITSQVTWPINKHCATPPKEESPPKMKRSACQEESRWTIPREAKIIKVTFMERRADLNHQTKRMTVKSETFVGRSKELHLPSSRWTES